VKTDRIFSTNDISKGGLIGALIGALSSTKIYNPNDKPVDKVIKTGATAGVGYLLGRFLENLLRKRT